MDGTASPHVDYPRIGGWLILPTIGLFLTPLFTLSEMIKIYDTATSLRIIDALQIMLYLAGLVFNIIVLVFVVNMKRQAPTLVISFYVFNTLMLFAAIAAIYYLGSSTNQEFSRILKEEGRGIFWTLIWIWYFVRSKRVKGTFVH